MNLIQTFITDILSEPQEEELENGVIIWTVDVRVNQYGRISRKTLTFDTREEALSMEEGDEILQ